MSGVLILSSSMLPLLKNLKSNLAPNRARVRPGGCCKIIVS